MPDQLNHSASVPAPPTLVVGLGASAGGVTSLLDFFREVRPDDPFAFVVILHLSPEFESRLSEVLQTATTIPVMRVTDGVRLRPAHVYVISPNQSLRMVDGVLSVGPVETLEERKAPVDIFFRTLGEAHRGGAVAIVLSGTGPNGSNGLKRVKEHGGLAIVQSPGEAEFDEMPNNSIATGLVDFVVPVRAMPARLREYAARLAGLSGQVLTDPPEGLNEVVGAPELRVAQDWRDILTLLRVRTGQDFSDYKPATIRRRVERRLTIRGVPTLGEYVQVMREEPDEALLLMKELLITVTNFFRDQEAFEALERRVVPLLFERRGGGDQVRVWSAGCATGEEAYSLAMLLAERASTMLDAPSVQVFATDLDAQAVAVAREGLYSESDVVDISPARLDRFFHREAGGYRVRRELRELVLFAHHNVIRDPPFSHLDLISCRNLLIYINHALQDRLLETFHFALQPGGFLFLGSSESADGGSDMFVAVDKAAHIFESRLVSGRPSLPLAHRTPPPPTYPKAPEPRAAVDRVSPGELHLRLLEQYAPPSMVVNEEYALVHASPTAALLLQMPGGEPSRDIFKLVVPDLRADLRSALHLAARERAAITVEGIRLGGVDAAARVVRLTVKPALRDDAPPRGYFLILVDDAVAAAAASEPRGLHLMSPAEPESRHLSEELTRVKGQLRATIEQYETHAEEARAANEELQAMNEELRSAAEELETSREELQSVNEELTTVNQELKIKIEELGLTNNDFQNLINATDIATIFLDRGLRVKLSTPRAQEIFNLLPTDIGRKLSDITSRLMYEPLHDDMLHVLERLHTIEREVQTRDGHWYLMRLLPYRTTDDRIDGVALTFHDIHARHLAEMQVRAADERLRLLIDSAVDYAVFSMRPDGVIDSWNTGAERMFGYAAAEIIGQHCSVLFTPEDRAAGEPANELKTATLTGRALDDRWHVRKDGSRFYCSGVTTRIGEGVGTGLAKIARDLTHGRQAEVALQQAHAELEQRVDERTQQLQSEVTRRASAQDEVTTLLRMLVTAQEDQRGRIARDLHDQLGQQLTALRLTLEGERERQAGAGDLPERALQLVREIDDAVDFLAWELRPTALDDLGLAAALPRYVDEWSAHHAIHAEFTARGSTVGTLPKEVETVFYRVAQEALNNVVKHASASRVDVVLEHRDGNVMLVIEDNGGGFDAAPEKPRTGFGLIGMRQRAALVGGTLDVESTPGEGTTVYLRCRAASGSAPASTGPA